MRLHLGKLAVWGLVLFILGLSINCTIEAQESDDDDDDDPLFGDDDDDDDDTGHSGLNDDDDDSEDGDDDNDDDDDDDVDDDITDQPVLAGTVVKFPDDDPLSTAQVELLHNDTGYPFAPEIKKYTQSNGSVRFEDLPLDPGDKVAVRVKATGFLDTYEYNFTVGSEDNEFRVAEEKLVEDIDTFLIGYDLLPGRSFISGGVYWKNKDGVEEGVGCATVEPELTSVGDPGDLIYFDWNNVFKKRLPDTSRDYTAPGNSPEAYGTKPLSLYIDVNAQAGDYTMTTVTKYGLGKINTQKIPNLCANCFAIARIVFDTGDYSSNPTPNDCE